MAGTNEIVEIRNETPLDIAVTYMRGHVLRPLETVAFERLPSIVPATFSLPALSGTFLEFRGDALPPVVTIDLATVARGQEEPKLASAEEFMARVPAMRADPQCRVLQVSNETIHVADVWLLDRTGRRPMGRIAPGGWWERPYAPRLLWHFCTPSGLTLGAFCQSIEDWGKEPFHVKLTTEFLDAWRAYQQRPALSRGRRGLAPLGLIGERRASTPGQDDPLFISASTVRLDISKEPFNGLENREVRDVEIAGPLLRWSGSNILSGYYGPNVSDIRSLTIYCDRMEVADRLHFPRTNVTIYARELAFTGPGRIDTTPLPYPGRAQSKYLTAHPDDPTMDKVPADQDGKPTYQAADGRKGEPGGNITIHARAVRCVDAPGVDAPSVRFICRGGKGQQGEAGGLKAYVRGEGQPEKYGPLPIVTADQVKAAFNPGGEWVSALSLARRGERPQQSSG